MVTFYSFVYYVVWYVTTHGMFDSGLWILSDNLSRI